MHVTVYALAGAQKLRLGGREHRRVNGTRKLAVAFTLVYEGAWFILREFSLEMVDAVGVSIELYS